MCGRTSMVAIGPWIEERFGATPVREMVPRYNIAPGDDLPAIENATPTEIRFPRWGLVPGWVDDLEDWPAPINARAETVAEKPAFRSAFEQRRCLVLADGFYEWKGPRGSKQPYRVVRPDEEPFAMAGLWETRERNGESLQTTAVITTDANEVVRPIHDRMPVILSPDEEERWLAGDDPEELQALLDPADPDALRAYPVSTAVNDPSNDDPSIIEEQTDPQSGLGDFS